MTVLTFPTSPIEGQQYAAPNGVQYVYDGVKWTVETITSTSEAVTNSTQDRVAPMFVDGDNTGITFTYDSETNVMSATVTAVNGDTLVNGVHEFVLGADGVLTLPSGSTINSTNNNIELTVGASTYTFSYDQMIGSSLEIPGSIQGPVQTGFLSSNGLGIAIDGFNSPNTVDIGNIPSSTVLRLKDGDGAGNIVVQSLGTSLKLQTNNNSTWDFNDNGTLTFPNGSNIEDTVGFALGGVGDVLIQADTTGTQQSWLFDTSGNLTFPDGTTQTTAYVTTAAEPLFVVVNTDGTTSWSNDGVTWSAGVQLSFNGTLFGGPGGSLQRVAVADSYITYIAYEPNNDLDQQLWYATSYNTNPTLVTSLPASGASRYFWNDIQHGGNYTVAVGNFEEDDGEGGFQDPVPVWAYTTNGSAWTLGDTDGAYQGIFGGTFNSVDYDGTGWFFVNDSQGNGGGAFYLTDLTGQLGEGNFIDFVANGLESFPDIDSVVWTGNRWWLKDATSQVDYIVSDSANPLTATWSYVNIASTVTDSGFGLADFYEDAGGDINGTYWFAVAGGYGQVLASSDGGANWITSVPLAYTGALDSATEASPCVIEFLETITTTPSPGTKVVITNANPSNYNGTYYADNNGGGYDLYTDSALTTPLDSTLFGTFVSGDYEFSSGTYIDSFGFGLGKFIAGNDDEQLFTSTDLSTWTKVDDQTNSFDYWNDISFNANWGAGAPAVTTGDITFDGVKIIGAGTASGDGNGYGTIELVPDNNLYANDQYLIIDPTVPGHIHIRAGGTQDASNAELFLGGEETHVMVADYNHTVNITTWNGDATNYNWNFGNDGTLTLPNSLSIQNFGTESVIFKDGDTLAIAGNSNVSMQWQNYTPGNGPGKYNDVTAGSNGVSFTTSDSVEDYTYGWEFTNDGTTYLPKNFATPTSYLSTPSGDDTVSLSLQAGNGVQIIADAQTSGLVVWNFGADGGLTTPNGLTVTGNVIEGAGTSAIGGQWTYATNYLGGTDNQGSQGVNLAVTTETLAMLAAWEADHTIPWTMQFFGEGTVEVIAMTNFGDRIQVGTSIATFHLLPVIVTSGDYQAATPAEVTLTADTSSWTFGADGGLTFPDSEVQTTAYSGGTGHMFMIDTNRTDTYTEVGSSDKPFKTFAAAIAAADAIDTTVTFVLMGCTVTENVDFSNTSFTSITIATTCRSVIDGNILIADVSAMSQMVFRNIEVAGTFTILGDETAEQFNSVSFYNVSLSGPVSITATNATAFYEVAFFDTVDFINLSYLYINGAQFNADWTITADDTATYPIPSRGINPGTGGSISIVFGTIANNVYFVKGGTAAYVFQPHMTRLGRTTESYTIPASWIVSAYGADFRGTWTNNGSMGMKLSGTDNRVLGTAPSYSSIVGGDRVIADLAPASSVGIAGDRNGMIAVAGGYLYVCTADYSDGLSDIWTRTLLTTGTW